MKDKNEILSQYFINARELSVATGLSYPKCLEVIKQAIKENEEKGFKPINQKRNLVASTKTVKRILGI